MYSFQERPLLAGRAGAIFGSPERLDGKYNNACAVRFQRRLRKTSTHLDAETGTRAHKRSLEPQERATRGQKIKGKNKTVKCQHIFT